MSEDHIDLRSVNWVQGLFLAPDHFLRQERYFDSMLLWMVRYGTRTAGLIGGGPRVDQALRGAAGYDPVVEIDETPDALSVAVIQCRGVTAGGAVIDIDPSRALSVSFPKRDLKDTSDIGVYVVARPHEKEPDGSIEDAINPLILAGRRLKYQLRLDVQADELPWSLLLARLKRADQGLRFERIQGFVPPCAYMSSHSTLMDAHRSLNDQVATLADRYGALQRAIVDYLGLVRSRGIQVDQDAETLAFVGRMVVTLEECAFRIMDPLQPPVSFFHELNRLVRSAALFLSLSPPTREYFRLLGEIGDVEFVSMLQQENETLATSRRWTMQEDLGFEIVKSRRALDRIDRLEQALEGKYLDYRTSPSLESNNSVFDRSTGDPILFKSVAKPARPQAHGQELTFVFAPLRLEAREVYRIILVGDRQAVFGVGDRVSAELRVNPGEGYAHSPVYLTADYEVAGQRNFALDFRAPDDVATINDVRVSLQSVQPIRSAILYVRGRLAAGTPAVVAPAPLSTRQPAPREPAMLPRAADPMLAPIPSQPSGRLGHDGPDSAATRKDSNDRDPNRPRRRIS